MLEHLRDHIALALDNDSLPELPDPLMLFHCLQPQHLHNVPLHYPCAIFVLSGQKSLHIDGHTLTIPAGDVLLLPPGHVALSNTPPSGGRYIALAVAFPGPASHAASQATTPALPQGNQWSLPTPDAIWLLLNQWVDGHRRHAMPEDWHQGRNLEIHNQLLASGQAGHLRSTTIGTAHRTLELFYSDLTNPWQLTDVAERLHCSVSTLQRQLAKEGTGFRELLEQARMVTALGFLQGSNLPIQLVAEKVGYQSASRFSERFRQHFGLLPKTLKETQARAGKCRFEGIK